jgi:hypothetical protein
MEEAHVVVRVHACVGRLVEMDVRFAGGRPRRSERPLAPPERMAAFFVEVMHHAVQQHEGSAQGCGGGGRDGVDRGGAQGKKTAAAARRALLADGWGADTVATVFGSAPAAAAGCGRGGAKEQATVAVQLAAVAPTLGRHCVLRAEQTHRSDGGVVTLLFQLSHDCWGEALEPHMSLAFPSCVTAESQLDIAATRARGARATQTVAGEWAAGAVPEGVTPARETRTGRQRRGLRKTAAATKGTSSPAQGSRRTARASPVRQPKQHPETEPRQELVREPAPASASTPGLEMQRALPESLSISLAHSSSSAVGSPVPPRSPSPPPSSGGSDHGGRTGARLGRSARLPRHVNCVAAAADSAPVTTRSPSPTQRVEPSTTPAEAEARAPSPERRRLKPALHSELRPGGASWFGAPATGTDDEGRPSSVEWSSVSSESRCGARNDSDSDYDRTSTHTLNGDGPGWAWEEKRLARVELRQRIKSEQAELDDSFHLRDQSVHRSAISRAQVESLVSRLYQPRPGATREDKRATEPLPRWPECRPELVAPELTHAASDRSRPDVRWCEVGATISLDRMESLVSRLHEPPYVTTREDMRASGPLPRWPECQPDLVSPEALRAAPAQRIKGLTPAKQAEVTERLNRWNQAKLAKVQAAQLEKERCTEAECAQKHSKIGTASLASSGTWHKRLGCLSPQQRRRNAEIDEDQLERTRRARARRRQLGERERATVSRLSQPAQKHGVARAATTIATATTRQDRVRRHKAQRSKGASSSGSGRSNASVQRQRVKAEEARRQEQQQVVRRQAAEERAADFAAKKLRAKWAGQNVRAVDPSSAYAGKLGAVQDIHAQAGTATVEFEGGEPRLMRLLELEIVHGAAVYQMAKQAKVAETERIQTATAREQQISQVAAESALRSLVTSSLLSPRRVSKQQHREKMRACTKPPEKLTEEMAHAATAAKAKEESEATHSATPQPTPERDDDDDNDESVLLEAKLDGTGDWKGGEEEEQEEDSDPVAPRQPGRSAGAPRAPSEGDLERAKQLTARESSQNAAALAAAADPEPELPAASGSPVAEVEATLDEASSDDVSGGGSMPPTTELDSNDDLDPFAAMDAMLAGKGNGNSDDNDDDSEGQSGDSAYEDLLALLND